MADEDQQDSTARLEPPRLFGRKKGRKASEPAPRPEPAPEPEPTPEPADVESTQVIEPEPAPEVDDTLVEATPVPPEEEAPPLFADEVQPAAAASPGAEEPEPAKEPKAPKAPKAAKEPRRPREPLPGRVAAALTGLVVGLALVGATAATLRGCEAVQNTATCGSAGFPLLLAIVVLMIVLGSVLLRTLRVPDPGSTSFLAVGVVSVVALLFFIEVIESWWMIIAIPAVSVASYLLSHWVTTTFIEPAEH
ncbi:MAG: hypothetical protein Q8O61_09865 [Nocardioides sp.]|nr:hypothetical protein [Nocardioides sp.]